MNGTRIGCAAAVLSLVLVTSCASGPLATPTARVVVPTPAPPTPTVAPRPTEAPKPTAAPTKPAPTPVPAPASPGRASGAKPGALPTAVVPPKPVERPTDETARPPAEAKPAGPPRARRPALPAAGRAALTAADGYLADGEWLSPFATDHPAVGNLSRDLRAAAQRAATDAAREGVELVITSGWRSARYQQALLDAAIAKYGSEAEARRWVSTPEKSDHVTGRAVDVGPEAAQDWLREHGDRYGLCQTYANEPWHYELATAPGGTCPRLIADASAG